MLTRPHCATAIIASTLAAVAASADDYTVYVLTGQSNSLGTTRFDGATAADYGPGADPADALTSFFWSNVNAGNTGYPPALYGDSSGTRTTLQMQQGDGANNPVFWGPEVGFARTLHAQGQGNVLIIKASRGGGGNGYWDRATFDANNDTGHMWGHLTDTVDATLSGLTGDGHTFSVGGLLYLQGESNNAAEAGVAGARLEALTSNLRSHINATYAGAANGMRLVAGEIAASQSNGTRQLTTSQQQALAAGDDDYAFIRTRDLPLQPDNIHFGRDAKLEIGRRYAHAMLGRQVAPVAFGDVAGATDGVSLVFDRYAPDGNGAANGTNLVNPGQYAGFFNGDNGEAAVGLLVDGTGGQVVFADYYSSDTTSDLAGGGPSTAANSGAALRFTFVDPADASTQAAVSGVAFELSATAGDNVRVRFIDRFGDVLLETGPNADGRVAYAAIDAFTGDPLALIHQVEVVGDASGAELWTLGHRTDDGGAPDFAFRGFAVLGPVPEPGTMGLLGTTGTLMLRRRAP